MTKRPTTPLDAAQRKLERTLRWQAWFAASAKAGGPTAIFAAHCWISRIRADRRRPDRIDSPAARKRIRRANRRDKLRFLLDRGSRNIKRAVKRNESMTTIRRRGLLDPAGKHQEYRGPSVRKLTRYSAGWPAAPAERSQ